MGSRRVGITKQQHPSFLIQLNLYLAANPVVALEASKVRDLKQLSGGSFSKLMPIKKYLSTILSPDYPNKGMHVTDSPSSGIIDQNGRLAGIFGGERKNQWQRGILKQNKTTPPQKNNWY